MSSSRNIRFAFRGVGGYMVNHSILMNVNTANISTHEGKSKASVSSNNSGTETFRPSNCLWRILIYVSYLVLIPNNATWTVQTFRYVMLSYISVTMVTFIIPFVTIFHIHHYYTYYNNILSSLTSVTPFQIIFNVQHLCNISSYLE